MACEDIGAGDVPLGITMEHVSPFEEALPLGVLIIFEEYVYEITRHLQQVFYAVGT